MVIHIEIPLYKPGFHWFNEKLLMTLCKWQQKCIRPSVLFILPSCDLFSFLIIFFFPISFFAGSHEDLKLPFSVGLCLCVTPPSIEVPQFMARSTGAGSVLLHENLLHCLKTSSEQI